MGVTTERSVSDRPEQSVRAWSVKGEGRLHNDAHEPEGSPVLSFLSVCNSPIFAAPISVRVWSRQRSHKLFSPMLVVCNLLGRGAPVVSKSLLDAKRFVRRDSRYPR